MKKTSAKNTGAKKNHARLLARLSVLVARAEQLVAAASTAASSKKTRARPARPAARVAKKVAAKKSNQRPRPAKHVAKR
jgi:membrane-bound lytic murein transglycosylase MltF